MVAQVKRISSNVRFSIADKFMAAIIGLLLVTPVSLPVLAAPSKGTLPLFSLGAESFRVQDAKGKTPQFRILDDSASEKALALGIIATLNASGVKPQIPVSDYIDLKVERLTLEPASRANPDEIVVALRLSGYELPLSKTISKKKFLSGELVEIDFPPTTKTVTVYDVESYGKLRMRWQSATQSIAIETAQATMDFESQFGSTGSETIKFSGKGLREARR